MKLPTEMSDGLHNAGVFLASLWDKVPTELQDDVKTFAADLHAKADAEIPDVVAKAAPPSFTPELTAIIIKAIDAAADEAAAPFAAAKAALAPAS